MTELRIIALKGRAGSGKSTAAAMLVEQGYERIAFATPLKRMIEALGLDESEMSGDLKEAPCAKLSGVSPRVAMQTLGTEWGRSLHPEFWTNLWKTRAVGILALGRGVVVDDCRFPNEAAIVRSMGGFVIEVTSSASLRFLNSPDEPVVGVAGHASELQDFDPDITVVNDKTGLPALRAALGEALDVLRADVADAA